MKNFKLKLEGGVLLDLSFDKNLVANYIKVISNIYYLNMRKVYIEFKENYIDKVEIKFTDNRDVNDILHKIYNDNLRETRLNVCKYFNIQNTEDLSLKLMIRIYYYYLPKSDYSRVMMDYINFQINLIFERLSLGYMFPLFLDENSLREPKDVIK